MRNSKKLSFKPEGRRSLIASSIKLRLAKSNRNSFNQIPVSSKSIAHGIEQVFVNGFKSTAGLMKMELKLKELCYRTLNEEEQLQLQEEEYKLKKYHEQVRLLIMDGYRASKLEKPETPLSTKLDNLVYHMELELTQKVVNQMSERNRRFLKTEFQVLEAKNHKDQALPGLAETNNCGESIKSFFARLENVASMAIETRERNNQNANLLRFVS